jgi:hypothetical protein
MGSIIFHGIGQLIQNRPPCVTHVLNHLCYRCIEPGPHLLRKPGAFERYRYREQLFPSRVFRQAYDQLVVQKGQRRAVVEYLQLLKLTSEVKQADVELMLVDFISPPYPVWSVEQLRRLLMPTAQPPLQMAELQPEWSSYDGLLSPQPEVACGR